MKSSINRQMKDSVFTKLFSKPENLKWMYEELLSEMDVQEKDIKILTLNSAMINGLRNDLAFSVKDEVIILCEAQSSWSENILIRMWLYLSETVKDYLSEHNVSLHQTAKIKMPKIHLFMIYTGNNKHVPKELSLAESFFQGDPSVLDLRIQVLSEAHGTGIVSQYIEFCKIQVECFKKYCTNAETAIKTVFKKCIEKGVLVDFLKKEEQEMEEIMSYLFNEEEERRLYNESLKREFLAEGIAKGEK
ncbi:MAG: Rpn family recombination-promoting nuclease/putative transposase, partial [Ileibacterium sp.]|nr:Rpn family recombination-promoting nuclease/putative transposase [Ileibacterium sp.]